MKSALSNSGARIICILLAAALGLACSDDSISPDNGSDPDPTPDPDPDVVEIEATDNLTFSSDDVTISAGTTVRWISTSVELHTVTPRDEDQEGVWSRQELSPDAEFEHTFEVGGQTYDYFCEPHEAEGMTGTITVE